METSATINQTGTSAPDSPAREKFNVAAVLTVSVAHFIHDLYPGVVGTLLPLLIQKHSLTLAAAGGLVTASRWPSAAQPFLGYLADRRDSPMLFVLPPLITALAITMLGLAPNPAVVAVLLMISGISGSSFHPTASAMVTRVAGDRSKWGLATSFFMTGGELGRAFGPICVVALVAAVGFGNLWIGAIPGLAISVLAFYQFKRLSTQMGRKPVPSGFRAAIKGQWRALLLLCGVITFRSLAISSFHTFYATYMTGSGASLMYAGLALSVYEAGGVAGAFFGGILSDRFGRREMMAISQITGGPLLFGALMFAHEPIGLVFLAIGGLLALSAGPVQLALAQELLPNNRSAASGIMMFLSFEGGIVATLATGFVADSFGLQSALSWSIFASMLSLPFTLLLPNTRPEPRAAETVTK